MKSILALFGLAAVIAMFATLLMADSHHRSSLGLPGNDRGGAIADSTYVHVLRIEQMLKEKR